MERQGSRFRNLGVVGKGFASLKIGIPTLVKPNLVT